MSGAALPYYKKFPRDFLEGTIGMNLEEKGAYSIVLDLIYMRNGQLPDDPQYIAGQLGCSVRKWNSIKKKLLEIGKLNAENGFISNFRADYLLEETRKYRDKNAENATKPKKNNDLEKRTPTKRARKPEPEPNNSSDELFVVADATLPKTPDEPEPKKPKATPRGADRGSRISENWQPAPKDYAFASQNNLTQEEINREADRFRNYWLGASGQKAIKRDWSATWRNWLTGDYGIVTKRAAATNNSGRKSEVRAGFDRVVADLEGNRDQRPVEPRHDGVTIEGVYSDASESGGSSGPRDAGRSSERNAGALFAVGQSRAG